MTITNTNQAKDGIRSGPAKPRTNTTATDEPDTRPAATPKKNRNQVRTSRYNRTQLLIHAKTMGSELVFASLACLEERYNELLEIGISSQGSNTDRVEAAKAESERKKKSRDDLETKLSEIQNENEQIRARLDQAIIDKKESERRLNKARQELDELQRALDESQESLQHYFVLSEKRREGIKRRKNSMEAMKRRYSKLAKIMSASTSKAFPLISRNRSAKRKKAKR